jgi:hypothetical protein
MYVDITIMFSHITPLKIPHFDPIYGGIWPFFTQNRYAYSHNNYVHAHTPSKWALVMFSRITTLTPTVMSTHIELCLDT